MVGVKKVFLVIMCIIGVVAVTNDVFSQCLPQSSLVPSSEIFGTVLCSDLSPPTTATLQAFYVDDVQCTEYDWIYSSPTGDYTLFFWIDNDVEHNVRVCISAECDDGMGGIVIEQGGFSVDGTTPGDCMDNMVFPQYTMIQEMSIVTPVKLSEFVSWVE